MARKEINPLLKLRSVNDTKWDIIKYLYDCNKKYPTEKINIKMIQEHLKLNYRGVHRHIEDLKKIKVITSKKEDGLRGIQCVLTLNPIIIPYIEMLNNIKLS